MNYRNQGNAITHNYYLVLMSHNWSMNAAYKVKHTNGTHIYFTYHLVRA